MSKEVVAKRLIPVPPLAEQKKIAYILSTVQQVFEQQERLIQVTTELKQALMHKLFTEGTRGEPQKETEIGLVPESWEVTPLEKLVTKTEKVDFKVEGNNEIEYIDVSCISRELLQITNSTKYILKDAPGRARKKVKVGDVIFATVRPTLKRIARISSEYKNQVCSTAFCVLRDKKEESNGLFIYYIVQREEFIKQLEVIQSGASYPAVTDRQVLSQKVPIPPLFEQEIISDTLKIIDDKINIHFQKQLSLKELFKTLLHQLMTAQIRVNDIEFEGVDDINQSL